MIRIFTSSVVDTSVVGRLQSVHNTFLRCLRDVSKSVSVLLCFSPAYSRDAKSCGYPQNLRPALRCESPHSSVVRTSYRYLEGRGLVRFPLGARVFFPNDKNDNNS